MKKIRKGKKTKIALLKLKEKIIDQTFNAFSVAAIFAYTITIYRSFTYSLTSNVIIFTLMGITLWTTTLLKNRISLRIKVALLASAIFIILIAGLSQFGFLASAKIYIPIVPIFVSFIYSYRVSLILLCVYLIIYLIFGILFVSNVIHYTFDSNVYITSYIAWVIDTSIILLTSWGLLYVGSLFHSSLISHNSKIERQNKKLIEYINMNSHEVRAPMARILGLLLVHKSTDNLEEKEHILTELHSSAESLDEVIKKMNRILEVELIEDNEEYTS